MSFANGALLVKLDGQCWFDASMMGAPLEHVYDNHLSAIACKGGGSIAMSLRVPAFALTAYNPHGMLIFLSYKLGSAHLCQVPGDAKPLPRRGAQPRVIQENVLGPLLPRRCPPEALNIQGQGPRRVVARSPTAQRPARGAWRRDRRRRNPRGAGSAIPVAAVAIPVAAVALSRAAWQREADQRTARADLIGDPKHVVLVYHSFEGAPLQLPTPHHRGRPLLFELQNPVLPTNPLPPLPPFPSACMRIRDLIAEPLTEKPWLVVSRVAASTNARASLQGLYADHRIRGRLQ
jgi:hypothetical protein